MPGKSNTRYAAAPQRSGVSPGKPDVAPGKSGVAQRGARRSPEVSQNFLTRGALIERLLDLTDLTRNDTVWEIGAGKGHLTAALARRCGIVHAVEIDPALCRRLTEKLAGLPNVKIHARDFLTMSLPADKPYKAFANIPFCITTDIVRKLTGGSNPPKDMWLAVQKQAALRFCGAGRETAASLSLKPFFDLKVVHTFRRDDFHPRPSVDVVLLRITQKQSPDLPRGMAASFSRFAAYGMQNGQRGLKKLMPYEQYKRALREADIPADFTPANLLYVQWLCLFRCFAQFASAEKKALIYRR